MAVDTIPAFVAAVVSDADAAEAVDTPRRRRIVSLLADIALEFAEADDEPTRDVLDMWLETFAVVALLGHDVTEAEDGEARRQLARIVSRPAAVRR